MIGRTRVGWREWVSLPDLGIKAIKAKIDTGARTSSLHAYFVEPFREKGVAKVRFGIHPVQRNEDIATVCVATVLDIRTVTNSGGHREDRFVIETPVCLGDMEWRIKMTLTNRDTMLFRMLLGRTAMRNRIVVDPSRSFLSGKNLASVYPVVYSGDDE